MTDVEDRVGRRGIAKAAAAQCVQRQPTAFGVGRQRAVVEECRLATLRRIQAQPQHAARDQVEFERQKFGVVERRQRHE